MFTKALQAFSGSTLTRKPLKEYKNIETELIKGLGVREIEFLHFHISVVCLLSLTRVRLCRISIRHIRTRVLKMQTPGYAENSRIQFPARPALLAALRKE